MSYTNGLDKPSDYFNTVLYTGNSSTQSITGVGFQPDWVWIKARSATRDHNLYDSVRGATKWLDSHQTSAEDTFTNGLTSFDSDGFSVGNLIKSNNNSETYASWNWLAGGSASSNTDGSITSSVSANQTAGFSIVSYTSNGSSSQTVGHGLGAVPQMIISKNRDSGSSYYNYWTVYHHSLATANDKKLKLNTSDAASTTNEWGDTDPTSTVYSIHTGGDGTTNHSSDKIIAYCFAEKKGYSKFGSYTGNGNSDGTFVYTGFKPAFLITKCTSNSAFSNSNWMLYDNKRDLYNQMAEYLYPDSSNASGTNSQGMDFLSNGIKMRNTFGDANYNNETYIYMAFAESPFVNSYGVPNNAR